MDTQTRLERPAYLHENEAFYSEFWAERDHYSSRFPNHDEAVRAGPVLECLSTLAERHGWLARPPRLLDAGCGRGWLTHLASLYGYAEGCEPVAGAVALARQLFPDVRFHPLTPGELRRTPGFDPFDVVICSEVIEHLPRESQASFVTDLRECLVPGGYLILTTPRGEMQAPAVATSNQPIEHWLSERELERMLRNAGLTPELRRRAYPFGVRALHRWLARVERWFGSPQRRSTAGVALDYRDSLYQIWCARRRD